MATRFDLAIDPATLAAAQRMADRDPRRVARSGSRRNCGSCSTHPNRGRGVRLLREFGLVEPVLPELVPTFTLPQGLPAAPTGTLWDHTVRVVGASLPAARLSFPLAFAALLHDVGKPRVVRPDRRTGTRSTGTSTSARQMAEAIADRLRLSNAEKTRRRVARREAPVPRRRADDAAEQAEADPRSPRHRRTARPAPRRRGRERQEPGTRRVLRADAAGHAAGGAEPAAGASRAKT